MTKDARDHGGGLDAAVARYGGNRRDWIDLSTGINPHPYPLPELDAADWAALPDSAAQARLIRAARAFWNVPESAAIVAAPGASSLIAQIPTLLPPATFDVPAPTYNELAASFLQAGWQSVSDSPAARAIVHPNNPDGRRWTVREARSGAPELLIIDESFGDVTTGQSLIAEAAHPGTLVLKSFGKFWGLAGARLGFVIGDPGHVDTLAARLGPWAVSGPALAIGAAALEDQVWADTTRNRLATDSTRLDRLLMGAGASLVGGTSLFRLYDVGDAAAWQDRLAGHHIWSRRFPYSNRWLRLGLPGAACWARLEAAL